MSVNYDHICRQCDKGMIVKDDEETICDVCEGYGYLLSFEGFALLEFLKRRGVDVPMSPRAEEELRGMIE